MPYLASCRRDARVPKCQRLETKTNRNAARSESGDNCCSRVGRSDPTKLDRRRLTINKRYSAKRRNRTKTEKWRPGNLIIFLSHRGCVRPLKLFWHPQHRPWLGALRVLTPMIVCMFFSAARKKTDLVHSVYAEIFVFFERSTVPKPFPMTVTKMEHITTISLCKFVIQLLVI